MTDSAWLLLIGLTSLAAVAIVSAALLKAWHGWIDLKRLELNMGAQPPTSAATRIELAHLRERVRRLEAIAEGTEI